ncbi:unnamed protein product [Periconia digitata]|uniref:Uncharacterized protein n=1 Tax=Periconia digitata TaxID=1303443 RepID=A0A9W4UIH3_9PLEO|nr:unnamed protein product [Periconia digitata]
MDTYPRYINTVSNSYATRGSLNPADHSVREDPPSSAFPEPESGFLLVTVIVLDGHFTSLESRLSRCNTNRASLSSPLRLGLIELRLGNSATTSTRRRRFLIFRSAVFHINYI